MAGVAKHLVLLLLILAVINAAPPQKKGQSFNMVGHARQPWNKHSETKTNQTQQQIKTNQTQNQFQKQYSI